MLYKHPDHSGEAIALDVIVRSNLLSYARYNASNELLEYAWFEWNTSLTNTEFNDWVRDTEILKQTPQKVRIIWSHAHLALIPEDYYQSDKREEYLQHLFEPEATQKLLEDESSDKHMFFPVDENIYFAARTKFPNATHHSAVLQDIEFVLASEALNQQVVAILDQSFLTLVHSEDGKLQFANSFQYSNNHEAAYFILNYYETSGLNREKLPLTTFGSPDYELKETLQKYISSCRFDHMESSEFEGHSVDLPLFK